MKADGSCKRPAFMVNLSKTRKYVAKILNLRSCQNTTHVLGEGREGLSGLYLAYTLRGTVVSAPVLHPGLFPGSCCDTLIHRAQPPVTSQGNGS